MTTKTPAVKVIARLQGKPNKAGELPLVIRYTFTNDGKTQQPVKSLKRNILPEDFDAASGFMKTNVTGSAEVNTLIASRCNHLRTAASQVPDPTDWTAVVDKYETLIAKQDLIDLYARDNKKIENVKPHIDFEDALVEKRRIEKKKRENDRKLALLASKGLNHRQGEVDAFKEKLLAYPETFFTSGQAVKNQITSWVNNIMRFAEVTGTELTFASMDMKFYQAYGDWIFSEGNFNNWFGACVKRLNTFLNKCKREGIVVNPAHTGFKVLREVKDIIYLNPEEVDMVWNYDGGERWRKYQDICVFGNLTGLRVSDIKESDFRVDDDMLVGTNRKTKTGYFIPLATDDRLEILLERYDFKMGLMSEQKYNKYIKELLGIIYKKHNIHQKPITIINYRWSERVRSEVVQLRWTV